jgi:hypothetical protein
VPLLEKPVQFLRFVGQDPRSGAARLVVTLPDAPYVYELDLDSDGVVDADLDPRAPAFDRSKVRGDILLVCLPQGQNLVTVIARSRFQMTRTLKIPIEVIGPPRCAPWSVSDDPRFSLVRPAVARAGSPTTTTTTYAEGGQGGAR